MELYSESTGLESLPDYLLFSLSYIAIVITVCRDITGIMHAGP
jgi:hypothetical protein